MHKKYAQICKRNMQIYANICPIGLLQLHICAKICKKYTCICNMCNNEIYTYYAPPTVPLCRCLDMGDATVGSIRGVGGSSDEVTTWPCQQHGRPKELKIHS